MSLLDICPSPAHRAALRLTGVALGAEVTEALLSDLAESDPVQLAEIANVEHVHTLLARARGVDQRLDQALPDDLWLYLEEMVRANAARLEQGRDELTWIGARLAEAGLEAVVLKGGAGLLSAMGALTAHRYISDLDILVAADHAEAAQEVLARAGGTYEPFEDLIAQRMHHLPPLEFPGHGYLVELHRETGAEMIGEALPAADLLARSRPSGLPGLRVPDMGDRHLHHMIHSGYESYDLTSFHMRAILDHHMHMAHPDGWARAEARMREMGLWDQVEALRALHDLAMGLDDSPAIRATGPWLRPALRRFGQPGTRRRADLWRRARTVLTRFATSPAHRRHYWQVITDRQALRNRFTILRDRTRRIR